MKLNKLDSSTLSALRKRGHPDAMIETFSAELAFDEWCEWNALRGFGPTLRRVMKECKAACRGESAKATSHMPAMGEGEGK